MDGFFHDSTTKPLFSRGIASLDGEVRRVVRSRPATKSCETQPREPVSRLGGLEMRVKRVNLDSNSESARTREQESATEAQGDHTNCVTVCGFNEWELPQLSY